MSCRDLEKWLAEGQELKPEHVAHAATCSGCGLLLRVLAQGEEERTVRGLADRLAAGLPKQLSAVRPLPSTGALTWLVFGTFAVFCLVVSAAVGFSGFNAMSGPERSVYYGLVVAAGFLFSAAVVSAAIPGAKVPISWGRVELGSALAVAIAVCCLFPRFEENHFVAHGVPCLRFGCLCALLFGALSAFALRGGYVTDVRRTALLVACFAGFSGVAVLSLHCSLLDAGHIVVWHLGAMAVSAGCAAVIGAIRLGRDVG